MIESQQLIQQTDFFNQDQREAIFCDTNCVVTAGAGSGKTSVLTYRFFRLVAQQKADVDQILTLTFTKAAAAQMYDRIYTLFSTYKDDPDIQLQLQKFSNATISTIDSFCYQVVQSDVTRFGLSPEFTLDNEVSAQLATTCAYSLLKKYANNRGVEFLSSIYSPEDLIKNVFVSIALQYFYPGDTFVPQEITDYITKFLRETTLKIMGEVEDMVQYFLSFDNDSKPFNDNVETFSAVLPSLRNLDLCIQNSDQIKELKKDSKKLRGKIDFREEYNETIDRFRNKVLLLSSFAESLKQTDCIEVVYEIFDIYRQMYLEEKRKQEVLTYNDVSAMAKVILVENDEVRTYFSNAYRYIMVDEFQDTNPLQKEIIYLLATQQKPSLSTKVSVDSLKKDKLFFVGDEKQSIYSFRGADVRVFKQLHQEILSSGGKHITLHTNYRSEGHLISLFNSLFERVFSSPEYDFEAEFTPLEAKIVPSSPKNISTSSLVIIPQFDTIQADYDVEDFENGGEVEAAFIAKKIKEMVEGDSYLIEKGGEIVSPSYSDIAILLRTTSPQMYYEKALRRGGIPYQLSSVKSLFLEAVMNDIYLLLQLIVYSDDLLSYGALLRSPFCNVDDDVVIEAIKKAKEDRALFTLDIFSSPQMERRYEALRLLYKELVIKSETESIAQLLSYMWYEGGYRVHLLSDISYSVYLEHFDYLIEVALDIERKGGSLVTFLDFLRERMGNSEKIDDIEVFGESNVGVQIMTIHKSKGLEFPIVIIANAGGRGRNLTSPPLFYCEAEESTIPVVHHMKEEGKGKNLLFEIEKERIEKSESAELKRLLYVAFTRAKNHLLITGFQNRSNFGEQHIQKNFLSMIYFNSPSMSEYEGKEGSLYIDENVDISFESEEKNLSHKKIRKAALSHERWYEKCEKELSYTSRVKKVTSIEIERGKQRTEETLEVLPSLSCDPILEHYRIYNHFGSWTHAMSEYVIKKMGGEFSPIDQSEYEKRMPRELNSLFLKVAEKKSMIASIEQMVKDFFHSTFYHSLHTKDLIKMESEVPFASRMKIENEVVVVNGVIDLLIHYTDHLVVLDFKTDALLDISTHADQLSLYRRAIGNIYQKEVSSVLVYLREKGCVRWLS
jgi:ATP-dependent exoDNAse (exonuclease V) beta subunit